jgi:N,N'-diacetylchitobiose phosphorylase
MRYGRFDDENREYVIERQDVPVSWTNYLGTRDMATVLSHNAGGYSFYKRTQQGRITRFRPNGVPLDRPGHYVYLRDDETGEFWTLSWQPVGKDLDKARYTTRHGLSYSKFECEYQGIQGSQTLFIPTDDDVELWDVRLRNDSGKPRKLSVYSYLEFSYHHVDTDNQNFQYSLYTSGSSYADGVIECDFFYDPSVYHYFTSDFAPDGFDCVRDKFLGAYRTESDPLAVERGACSGSHQLTGNHCGVLQKRLTLAPGAEQRLTFMLGVGDRRCGAAAKAKYSDPAAVDTAFAGVKAHWAKRLEALQCSTPDKGFNSMINTWNLYQAETAVVWSRFASFIEVGGRRGIGYRDTAQDVMGVTHTNPAKVRSRLLQLLQAQMSQGYGLHLFDPDHFDPALKGQAQFKSATIVPGQDSAYLHGVDEACSDDHLWIVPAILEYVKETGDTGFLEEPVPYADKGEATVYGHLKAALDFSIEQVGASGICKGLVADWNDCLNLGGGESAMTSFLHYWALDLFVEAANALGQPADAARYAAAAVKVRQACEKTLWDGDWYLRGFTAKGAKIGTHADKEGKVHLESNSLAVLSGCATGERAEKALQAIDEHLFSPWGIHLVWPAYGTPDESIGYVTKVYKGVKENGAIFSHPNPWAIIAAARLGQGGTAMKYYKAINPYDQNDKIETREAEPYSYVQFIYGQDHTLYGKAMHPWLTGTASWMYGAATRWILGVRLSFKGLLVDPCVPADWKGFTVQRRWRGALFHIKVQNPDGVQKGVRSITLNGKPVDAAIPPQPAGSVNAVEVIMGEAQAGEAGAHGKAALAGV